MPPTEPGAHDPSLVQKDPPALMTDNGASPLEMPNPPAAVPVPISHATSTLRTLLHPSLVVGVTVLIAGLAVNNGCLRLSERLVPWFPSVPDVIQAQLPYVDFGLPGEMVFFAFLITCATLLFMRQPRAVASVLCLIGTFYAIRGVFLLLLPIGTPPTAPPDIHRFALYPYADHAYFPGGHAGLMTILSLSMADLRWRRALLVVTILFAFGSVMARYHYTADVLAGGALGYGLVAWGRARLAYMSPIGLTPPRR